MSKLSIEVNGLKFDNPFIIGSGPPSTNARVMCNAFKAGWGGIVAKTVALTSTPVTNVSPRYGKLKTDDGHVYRLEGASPEAGARVRVEGDVEHGGFGIHMSGPALKVRSVETL